MDVSGPTLEKRSGKAPASTGVPPGVGADGARELVARASAESCRPA